MFVVIGTTLTYYKNEESYSHGEHPVQRFSLAGNLCVVNFPDFRDLNLYVLMGLWTIVLII